MSQEFHFESSYEYPVQIPPAILTDSRLSWKAVGILCYLIGKPDGWIPRINDLINRHTDGEKAVQSGLKELEAAGYLWRFKIFINGGYDWRAIVSDVPLTKEQFLEKEGLYLERLAKDDPTFRPIPPKGRYCNTTKTAPLRGHSCDGRTVRGSISVTNKKKRNQKKKETTAVTETPCRDVSSTNQQSTTGSNSEVGSSPESNGVHADCLTTNNQSNESTNTNINTPTESNQSQGKKSLYITKYVLGRSRTNQPATTNPDETIAS